MPVSIAESRRLDKKNRNTLWQDEIDKEMKNNARGSIPAKVGFWVGIRMFSYVRTPTKLTKAISKTQLSGPKKGGFSPKIPRMWTFFCIWRVLAFLAV